MNFIQREKEDQEKKINKYTVRIFGVYKNQAEKK
jgi:hypothetical protein